ncbi:YecA family protein [Brevibacillus choshinensis]|uniref:SEC-C domain-containing protein n=1 Tax=Brevibacillus choshinensis TaxID=54911 RepID=A0ABX7FK95_BRECH|nr:SEC-C domain-containing protein [Brevibacillus choshinensis]QRG66059.1 SEC-C domain-containing protein [Brevibacillus choshinensis]
MSVGRNELCPCGSGKKYKKCCGVVTPITELRSRHEQKLQKEYAGWVERLNHFVGANVTSEVITEARSRFADEVGLPEESVMRPEWAAHFFNWCVLDVRTGGSTLLENYVKQHGRRMEPDLRRAFAHLHLNVYEVMEVDRDVLTVQQPISLETHYLLRSNNLQVQPGQVIVGRLLNLGLRDMLFSGSIILQPHVKQPMLEWLHDHPEVQEAANDTAKRVYTTDLYRFIVQFGDEGADQVKAAEALLRRSYSLASRDQLIKDMEATRSFELKRKDAAGEIWVYATRKEEHLFPALKGALLELYEVQAEVLIQDDKVMLEGYAPQLDEVADLLQLHPSAGEEEINVLTSTGSKLSKGTLFITSQPTLPPKVLQWAVQTYFAEKWLVTPHEALDDLAPILVAASDNEELHHKLQSLMEQMEQDNKLGQGLARFIRMDMLRPRLALENKDLHVNNLLRRPLIEGLPESVYTVHPERLADMNRFVQEMTDGKSEATVKKYDEVMNNFRSFVRGAFGPTFTWDQMRKEDLVYFLVHDIFVRADATTKTLAANLLSVLTAFFKWLDKQGVAGLHSETQPLFAELKETLPEAYRLHGVLEKEANQNLFGNTNGLTQLAEETLMLLEPDKNGWIAKRSNGETIKLSLSADTGQALAPDWMIAGLFGQTEDGSWKVFGTPELYPPVVALLLGIPTSVLV